MFIVFHLHFGAFIRHFWPLSYTDDGGCHAKCWCTSRAVWGSVSCLRTLQHAGQGNRTCDPPITRHWLYPWATATLPLFPSRWTFNVLFLRLAWLKSPATIKAPFVDTFWCLFTASSSASLALESGGLYPAVTTTTDNSNGIPVTGVLDLCWILAVWLG